MKPHAIMAALPSLLFGLVKANVQKKLIAILRQKQPIILLFLQYTSKYVFSSHALSLH